ALRILKIKNVKLPWVLFGGGLFTVFWGAMFDTWFGASVKPMLINPLTDTLPMMMLCLGMGVLHLLAGMSVAAYMNIKRGKPLDALYDQGFWVFLILGVLLLLLPPTAAAGKYVSLGSLAGILLTAGRANKNPVKRLLGGLGALYNVTGWLSDILSYLRLFGMGLATGVVGMVINTLVGMMMTNVVGVIIGVPILIFGHAFNMGINALGAYVHACRLQYIEFFGKFYEDGGKPFLPLRQTLRYATLRASGADE
nr:V-type ATPase 116kDa subunit family protein [Clostridia bacterium]